VSVDYGLREVQTGEDGNVEVEMFDFSADNAAELSLKVDIGSAAYWSELMQVQTMDNLFAKGVISDVITYLEGIPEQYLRNKSKIIAKLKNSQKMHEPVMGTGSGMMRTPGVATAAMRPSM
ncbi:MAG: hypothetical protein IJ299_01860, partial [Oscillospiraceae bacterium]|nr:hypothetical protein [Oscillospiraceae bacterium]